MLSNEAVKEFKMLYENEYKITLSDKEALEYGTRLVNMVSAVYEDDLATVLIDNKANKRDN